MSAVRFEPYYGIFMPGPDDDLEAPPVISNSFNFIQLRRRHTGIGIPDPGVAACADACCLAVDRPLRLCVCR